MDIEKYGKKLIGNDEERAVSPVIGVILMVAITVILAAVIAAFVLDLGQQSEPAQAAVDVDGAGDDATITVSNADRVDDIVEGGASECDFSDISEPEVGESEDIGSCSDDNRLVVVAEYNGNSEIILDTEI
ncbi:type IV pilin [Natronolimnobius sp. AArcel1]|uniref:type IV pilin n=1 Tax=Natronolimnobius sp. AArcel1 TaxID=1679093 RepID=UPI0013EC5E0B|nr:type IV pilin N-terminal domain-containing protein [Natronolimnobius sp. AArcel1]NGM69423.1 type IV pilin [Natronolimnobius sp. AArcel1]